MSDCSVSSVWLLCFSRQLSYKHFDRVVFGSLKSNKVSSFSLNRVHSVLIVVSSACESIMFSSCFFFLSVNSAF